MDRIVCIVGATATGKTALSVRLAQTMDAEIVSFDDLKANGSMTACKEKGLVRSEGKDYVMQDGDVTLFRFNVSK